MKQHSLMALCSLLLSLSALSARHSLAVINDRPDAPPELITILDHCRQRPTDDQIAFTDDMIARLKVGHSVPEQLHLEALRDLYCAGELSFQELILLSIPPNTIAAEHGEALTEADRAMVLERNS